MFGGVFLFIHKEEENMEMKLRPYKAGDARTIISWIKDETALRKWSSDRYGAYPITAQDINYKYLEKNGIV